MSRKNTYDDVDDLIGGGAPAEPRPKAKAKPRTKPKPKKGEEPDFSGDQHPDNAQHTRPGVLGQLHGGVTVTFLADLFGMAKPTVHKRLKDCPPLKLSRNAPIYSLTQAAAYLVTPRIDLSEYLKTLRPSEIPTHIQKDFWDAMIKKQKWEQDAGVLWHDDDVIEVFGEVFKEFKTSVQLWADEIERVHGLTDAQRRALVEASDKLLTNIYDALVEIPKKRRTLSMADQTDKDGLPLDRKEEAPDES